MEEKDVMTLKASDILALGDDDWGSDGCLGGREGLLLVGVAGYLVQKMLDGWAWKCISKRIRTGPTLLKEYDLI